MQQFITPKGMVHGHVLVHPTTGDPVESSYYSLAVLDITHYLNHQGHSYSASKTLTIGSGVTKDFILVNPTAFEVHITKILFESTALDADILIYKGAITTDDGTSIPFVNRNLNSVNTCDAVLTENPTGLDIGSATLIETNMINAAKHSAGSVTSESDELILKQNQKLVIRYTNNAVGSDIVNLHITALNVGRA